MAGRATCTRRASSAGKQTCAHLIATQHREGAKNQVRGVLQGLTHMPVYFGMYLLQQMTLAAMFSWWLRPLVSKGVNLSEFSPPLIF